MKHNDHTKETWERQGKEISTVRSPHNYQSVEDSGIKYQELIEELAHSIITI
jgi:hypothetical protein